MLLGSLAFTMTCSIIAKQTLVQRGLALTRYVVLGYTLSLPAFARNRDDEPSFA